MLTGKDSMRGDKLIRNMAYCKAQTPTLEES